MPFARASELDRLLKCAGSTWLPRLDTRSPSVRAAADYGTAVHAWMETGRSDNKQVLRKVQASCINREHWWPPEGHHEVGLAYNVVTGRAVMVQNKPRDFIERWKAAFNDDWAVGTSDYCGELLGQQWVDDLKTGARADIGKFAAQLRFYALAWGSCANGGTAAFNPIRATITHWPRYPLAGLPVRTGVVIEGDDLRLFAESLAELRRHILWARTLPDASNLLVAGSQCTYCPSRSTCPQLQTK